VEDEWFFQRQAFYRLYEKPWYEVHALRFLDWLENQHGPVLSIAFAGKLGRLVEQYYWRFRFEDVAATGLGARRGASAGGKVKAALHRTKYSAWQNAASEIWARRPELSKIAVAQKVRTNLSTSRTAKHIARYIRRP